MSKRQEKKVAGAKAPEVRVPPDMPAYYANNTSITVTPWDISLLFGRIVEVKAGKVLVDQFAKVTMSPQHAKAVVNLLEKQLGNYEETHGPIPDKGYAITQARDDSKDGKVKP